MKLQAASFLFKHPVAGTVLVEFDGDQVTVQGTKEKPFVIENGPAKWGGRPFKPCVTHALEAIAAAAREPAKTEQARQRKLRPKLQLHKEE